MTARRSAFQIENIVVDIGGGVIGTALHAGLRKTYLGVIGSDFTWEDILSTLGARVAFDLTYDLVMPQPALSVRTELLGSALFWFLYRTRLRHEPNKEALARYGLVFLGMLATARLLQGF